MICQVCKDDHNNPNRIWCDRSDIEIQYDDLADKIEWSIKAVDVLQKQKEELESKLAKAREALERIDSECSRDDTIAWKIASDVLEELK